MVEQRLRMAGVENDVICRMMAKKVMMRIETEYQKKTAKTIAA
jgi:hypothetical protein